MLAIEARRLTASERELLLARRAELLDRIARDASAERRLRVETARVAALLPGFFAAICVFNLGWGKPEAALVAGLGAAVFTGVVVWLRFVLSFEGSFAERRELASVEAALEHDEVRVVQIEAHAAVTVHDPDDELLGQLLWTGADQLVFVDRSVCRAADLERLPNSALRIVLAMRLGVLAVELTGERIEPRAVVTLSTEDDAHLLEVPGVLVLLTPSTSSAETFDCETGLVEACYGLDGIPRSLLARIGMESDPRSQA